MLILKLMLLNRNFIVLKSLWGICISYIHETMHYFCFFRLLEVWLHIETIFTAISHSSGRRLAIKSIRIKNKLYLKPSSQISEYCPTVILFLLGLTGSCRVKLYIWQSYQQMTQCNILCEHHSDNAYVHKLLENVCV